MAIVAVELHSFCGYSPFLTLAISLEQNQKEFGTYKILLKLLRGLLSVIPSSLLLRKLSSRFLKDLEMETPEQTKQVIYLVQQACQSATKDDCQNVISDMIDSINHAVLFYPEFYRKRADKILIIDCEDDKAIPKNIKAAMYQLCPGAKSFHFKTGGHTPMFTKTEEYKKILLDFLLN